MNAAGAPHLGRLQHPIVRDEAAAAAAAAAHVVPVPRPLVAQNVLELGATLGAEHHHELVRILHA